VHFSAAEKLWVAAVDWNAVYHVSDKSAGAVKAS
jgi:hypothetical protein